MTECTRIIDPVYVALTQLEIGLIQAEGLNAALSIVISNKDEPQGEDALEALQIAIDRQTFAIRENYNELLAVYRATRTNTPV